MFDHLLNELNQEQEPFFSTLFTISTHSPYDMPMEWVLDWAGKGNGYINSGYYTDRCIGDFIREAKQQSWFENTLFIFVADHSHHSYKHWGYYSPEYRRIPILFYGNVIKDEYQGTQINKLGTQVDLPSTLINQMGWDAGDLYGVKTY